ncbi:MAG TPA: hypothetical protein VNB68_02825 [Nitrososphaeraceae archaeon]|nr:hypothetical protein [Nitrososphaeraceae archaeon]
MTPTNKNVMKVIIEEPHYSFKFFVVQEQTIVLNSTSDRRKLAVKDGEGETLSNTANPRYIIISACGYGNMGDDAIMLGTAKYLIQGRKQETCSFFHMPHRKHSSY